MTYSVRNIVIALVLAAVAAALVIVYTGSVKHQAEQSQSTVTVLVASQDIPAGTTVSDALSQGDFSTKSVIGKDVIPGALPYVGNSASRSLAAYKSMATSVPVTTGAQITGGMFAASH